MKKNPVFFTVTRSGTHFFLALVLTLCTSMAFSQEKVPVKAAPSALSSPALYIMLGVILVLLFQILAMGESIKAAAFYRSEKEKKKNSRKTNGNITTLLLVLLLGSNTVFGQEQPAAVPETPVPVPADYWGLDPVTFYVLLAVIAFELLIWWMLRNISLQLLRTEQPAQATAEVPVKAKATLMEKLNASVSIEKEEEIMLDHEYDGIRELDNNLPPWWKYGFYVSIVFSFIYLVHYHVLGTGKLQEAEYLAEMKKAEEDLAEYRRKAADLVDETNATFVTDNSFIGSGKSIFLDNCAACHGKQGEGGVGPNLTDDYWLHSGSIKDIFKSVKYGWPEKGMIAWQQNLSPKQIHQVTCYIKSIRGTNPPNAKEKQGELYTEETTVADSLKNDTTNTLKEKIQSGPQSK